MITAQVGAIQPSQCFLGPPLAEGRPALCMHCGASLYRHTYICTLPKYQQVRAVTAPSRGFSGRRTSLGGREQTGGQAGSCLLPSVPLTSLKGRKSTWLPRTSLAHMHSAGCWHPFVPVAHCQHHRVPGRFVVWRAVLVRRDWSCSRR